jgi:aldose 1-epimerase
MAPDVEIFGKTPDGRPVELFTLVNRNGLSAKVMTWGAILVSLRAPDREGRCEEVNLGFDTLEPYLANTTRFGALCGRYAGRIGGARFTLDGADYKLAANAAPHHIHGGAAGFNRVLWEVHYDDPEADTDAETNADSVTFAYLSRDGEEGYPGNMQTRVTYALTKDDELSMRYEATTDRPTTLNLTNHAFWNLAGATGGHVYDHEIQIEADEVVVTDDTQIPTGEIRSVAAGFDGRHPSSLDLRRPTPVGAGIRSIPPGYDHTYVLRGKAGGGPHGEAGVLRKAATVYEPGSGRIMEVLTTEPGLQFYTANHLKDVVGPGSHVFMPHEALCLEAQHFPDSVHHPHFPSTILRPGETYRQTTVHRFTVAG